MGIGDPGQDGARRGGISWERRIAGPLTWTLVTGAPRSGTTLMRQLISHHPQAGIFHECGLTALVQRIEQVRALGSPIFITEAAFGRHVGDSVPAGVTFRPAAEAFYAERESDSHQSQRSVMPRRPGDIGFDEIAAAIVGAVFNKPDIQVAGDKFPIAFGSSEYQTAKAALGSLKVVLIIRRPLDTINSSMRRRERARAGVDEWHIQSVAEACDEYASSWRIAREIVLDAGPDVHVVRYDELCSNQEQVMRGVFDFLGIAPIAPADGVRALPTGLAASYLTLEEHAEAHKMFGDLERRWSDTPAVDLLKTAELLSDCPLDTGVALTDPIGKRLLMFGFAAPEQAWVWTEGPLAIIRARHPHVQGRLLVELWAAMGYCRADAQCDVIITVNGEESFHTIGGAPGQRLALLTVPAADDVLDIRLEPLRPKRTDEELQTDPRRVGVALTHLRLSAVRGVAAAPATLGS